MSGGVQVAGYLQSVTSTIDIDLVTVAPYDVNGSQVLVPQRIEPGSRPAHLTDARVIARQGVSRFPGSGAFAPRSPMPQPDSVTCCSVLVIGQNHWNETAWPRW